MPKTKFSAVCSTFVVCMGFWLALTWTLDTQELIAGVIVSLAASLFTARFFIHEKAFWFFNPLKLLAFIAYGFVLLWELIKANIDMAIRCFGGCKKVNPGIVKVPVELDGLYPEAMLANSITLTPGTITLDCVEEDGKNYFYVHWIDVSETDRVKAGEIIKGRFERAIGRMWGK